MASIGWTCRSCGALSRTSYLLRHADDVLGCSKQIAFGSPREVSAAYCHSAPYCSAQVEDSDDRR
jgi:hypothetical protein